MTKKNVLSLAIVLAGLIGLYFGSVYLREQNNLQNRDDLVTTPTDSPTSTKYRFKYVPNYDPDKQSAFTEQTFDGKIVRIDPQTKQEMTVIPSVKDAYPIIKTPLNRSLYFLSESPVNQNLYFSEVYYETDGGLGGLIKFDAQDLSLKALSISSQFSTFGASYSKTSPYAATIIEPGGESTGRKLYVLNFDKDTATLLDTLPIGLTFDICSIESCFGGYAPTIDWVSAGEFEVTIYDSKFTADQYGNGKAVIIEKRKYKVQ